MGNRTLLILVVFAIFSGVAAGLVNTYWPTPELVVDVPTNNEATTTEPTFCAADAMLCSDGSYVGRTGANCEFVCPPSPEIPADLQAHIDSKVGLIKVVSPIPMGVVTSPLTISGEARGNWFFEASAPVSLVNWDGLIIAEGIITAQGDWMTTEFVPFTGTLEFTSPYKEGDQDFMKRGAIIFQKDNPSGLPENDDHLEFTIWFAK